MGSWGPSAETFGAIFTMLLRSTPVGGRGSQETGDRRQPRGPAGVTPGVPAAGTTPLWRPSGICPAPHPTLPAWAGPSSHAYMGCGVWGLCTLALSSQRGQRGSEDARQGCSGRQLCLGGSEGSATCALLPGGSHWSAPWSHPHPCWQTQKKRPLCRTHLGTPPSPVQCLVPMLCLGC